ncbi:hypothetical protein Rs2_52623 [Raphanus sativus]|uniref:Thioredoxin-like 1-2, chloroplastic n=1 Tax=Raphanus sativus TaxID=3726 RepID=A0A6J0LLM2_RAPSA|nr:thioredoxin-like 1-2, chloroplastic [Raphanus sativus]KAJ4865860.1 hypothetical protein Rs2_52623 [Raphanus sativus]
MDAVSPFRAVCGSAAQYSGTRIDHGLSGFCSFSQENKSKPKLSPVMSLDLKEHPMSSNQTLTALSSSSSYVVVPTKTSSIGMSRGMRWWEKSTKDNMLEIHSANHLVDSLLNAGDRLVVLDFYSPGCGGCKSLHPKICQLAETNPNVMFLKVNQEELRTMCHGLNVHVLPFFKFYRGAEGKLCSFSCTIATINKFKKALDKHGSERCSLGQAKGLDSKELMALASVGELKMNLDSLTVDRDVLLPLSSASSFCYETEQQHQKMVV